MTRLEFDHFPIVLAREVDPAEIIGVKFGEREVSFRFVLLRREQRLKLLRGVRWIPGIAETHRKIIARFGGVGTNRQCALERFQGALGVAGIERNQAEIELGLEERRIQFQCPPIQGNRYRRSMQFVRAEAFSKVWIRFYTITIHGAT